VTNSVLNIYMMRTEYIYIHGKVCSRRHDLLNDRTDLLETVIFRKPMIWHCWQSPLFLLILSQVLFIKQKSNIEI
jgi:hypothetical protein